VPQRANRRSFSFGSGRHQCPGQALAMSIAAATLNQILASGLGLNRLSWDYRPSLNGRVPLFNICGG
jgi:cytochrome P450